MTEAEWLTCELAQPMLESLRGELSERKFRLFAVVCCRRIGHLFVNQKSWWAIEVCERYADHLATAAALEHASDTALQVFNSIVTYPDDGSERLAASAAWGATASTKEGSGFGGEQIAGFAINTAIQAGDAVEAQEDERRAQAELVRDIFGNPFRPVTFLPAWRSDAAVQLAKQMYESREFSAMSILADALQDAGCDSDDVLSHCREPGTHVRGCWVVDQVLGLV